MTYYQFSCDVAGVVLCLYVCLFADVRLCSRMPSGRGRGRLVSRGPSVLLYCLAHLYFNILLWFFLMSQPVETPALMTPIAMFS